ncbi:MAG: protein kinase [Deltaproteobacteria bacterium]|nr:protein kinase [Deltaproteobacteria bacterium]
MAKTHLLRCLMTNDVVPGTTPDVPAPAPPKAAAPAGLTIGRYVLFPAFAQGGMASVHIGRMNGPVGFSRTVAIKRLHPEFARDADFVSMFLDEARLAARIQHPNVVSVLDVVSLDGELFLVMDFIRGDALSRMLQACREKAQRAPVDVVVAVLIDALHGLHAAHEARNEQGEALNMVHRDVSPQNILVGVDGVARLVDFGVAKAADRVQTTRNGQLKGKLDYMAPEQLECCPATRQTDIYAATVVLWEGLTGERMLRMGQVAARAIRILKGNFPAPGTLNPAVSPELDAIVRKGLSRNPAERFETAREMALALEGVITPAPKSRVGEWVATTAAEALRQRDHLVTQVETVSDSSLRGSPSLTAEAVRALVASDRSSPDEPDELDERSAVRDVPSTEQADAEVDAVRSELVSLGKALDDPFASSGAHAASDLDFSAVPLPEPPEKAALSKRIARLALATGIVCLLGTAIGIRWGMSGTIAQPVRSLGSSLVSASSAVLQQIEDAAKQSQPPAQESPEPVAQAAPAEPTPSRTSAPSRASLPPKTWVPKAIEPAPAGTPHAAPPKRDTEFSGLTRR